MNIEDIIILSIAIVSLSGLILLIISAGGKTMHRKFWLALGFALIICAIIAYFVASFIMSQLYPPPNFRYLILLAPNGF